MLFLFAAYRSLGGAASKPVDAAVLLRSLHQQLLTSITSLRASLTAVDEEATVAPDAAGNGRKLSAAVQQSLDRLPTAAELDNRDATIKSLLGAAAEDTAWAWRMVAAEAASPAVSAAATALADHAATCCEQAATLLAAAPLSEPGDGP